MASVMKIVWATLSITGFVGTIVGLALPVIPGIPFLLLTVYSLKKLSPRFHRWLLETRVAGWLRHHHPKLAHMMI